MFEIFLLLLIPFCLPRTFGKMVGDNRQGYAILAAMVVIWLGSPSAASTFFEAQRHHGTARRSARAAAHGGQGDVGSALPAPAVRRVDDVDVDGRGQLASTTRTRRSAAASALDMMLGEVAPGGVGSGLYGILVLAIVAVFVARPDGRPHAGVPRQEDPAGEMKLASLYILTTPVSSWSAPASRSR